MSATSPRRPHWLALSDRTALLAALTAYLRSLPALHPDRFTLTEVASEVGVAAARAQLDRVPPGPIRAAAGISVESCQIRLSASELAALRLVPGLPAALSGALGSCVATAPEDRVLAGGQEGGWST